MKYEISYDARMAVKNNQKIMAIKIVRTETGACLLAAKRIIEAYAELGHIYFDYTPWNSQTGEVYDSSIHGRVDSRSDYCGTHGTRHEAQVEAMPRFYHSEAVAACELLRDLGMALGFGYR